MEDSTVRMQVSGTPADPFPVSSPTDWWETVWAHLAPYLPPIWVWWITLALMSVVAGVCLLRFGWKAFHQYVAPRPTEDILTVVAAAIATSVSAQGMWRFSGDVLGLDGPLRLLLFAFIEVAIIASAVRARRNMRENFSAGIDGTAVWALTCLTAVLSSMDARSIPEAVFRLAAPLVAAWLWERGMAIERHRIRGTSGIHWRFTWKRILVRLGLAEATDRTAGDVDRARRLDRVALAVVKLDDLKDASDRKQRAARKAFRKALAQAVEHAGLATDEAAQDGVLHRIDTLRSADVLAARRRTARWADPVTQEQKAEAEAALEAHLRFDSAEALQRAIDKTAVTLMALTERVTPGVITEQVTPQVTSEVTHAAVPAPRNGHTVTLDVTPSVTVERVTPAVTFDVTNPDAYALERLLSDDPYVTPHVTGDVSPDVTEEEVTEDADDAPKTQVMRAFWDAEVAKDNYPSPKELSDHAGAHPSLASRKRKEWVAELPWRKRLKADRKRERTTA
jgi:hypothetical protein